MISVNDLPIISSLLSSVFFYGFNHGYSFLTIEERIIENTHIGELEDGDSSFLIRNTIETLLESFFQAKIDQEEALKTNPISLWLGEIYMKIFFTFHKSFSFIFLYLPLSEGIKLFDLYHEMDYSQTLNHFASLTQKESILSLLLKKREMTVRKLGALTGINHNTIISFTRGNRSIYNAKFEFIYRISKSLKVPMNLFISNIDNYSDSGMFEFDKMNVKYRSYLGLHLISYFSGELDQRKYVYDEDHHQFVFGDHLIKTFFTDTEGSMDSSNCFNEQVEQIVKSNAEHTPLGARKDQILMIFEYNKISESIHAYASLLEYGFEKIYIINAKNILCIGERHWVGVITDSIKTAMIRRAKQDCGGDFAI